MYVLVIVATAARVTSVHVSISSEAVPLLSPSGVNY